MSAHQIIEPHYHQNAAETIYCISGSVTVSILNPFTKQILNYTITPGQIVNVPKGWWHYELALTDQTHLLAIFNAPMPEVILGIRSAQVDTGEYHRLTPTVFPSSCGGKRLLA